MSTTYIYLALAITMVISLYVDLKGHGDKEMSLKQASLWALGFVTLGVAFGGFIYVGYGAEMASLYYAGYALEKALSVDNLLVFTAVFTYFGIKSQTLQHKILTWGILGAVVFRGLFVMAGTWVANLHWSAMLVFAAIIAFSAYGMLGDDDDVNLEESKVVKLLKKIFPVSATQVGEKFFFAGMVTPAFLALVTVELMDVVFAFDSVPAIIAVTKDNVLVYSAMVMAILGLRPLYFVLQSLLSKLPHLKTAVVALLFLVAGKLVAGASGFHMNPNVSLGIIVGILALGCIPFSKKVV